MRIPYTPKTRQRGAVLIVSLLVLLVLTLLGISSLDNSVLEEKMASNAQTSTTTFQKAESSIREAYHAELPNPAGAVGDKRQGATPVARDETVAGLDITSSSQHVYPSAPPVTQSNSSGSTFQTRHFEVIGTANVGNIQNRNIQGYRVTNMMVPSP